MAGLERGVLAAGALAVVLVPDDAPAHAGRLVGARRGGDGAPLARLLVAHLVQLAVLGVSGAGRRQIGNLS